MKCKQKQNTYCSRKAHKSSIPVICKFDLSKTTKFKNEIYSYDYINFC